MLEDLSAHILDVSQNSVAAGAVCVEIIVRVEGDFIGLEISDDGAGMAVPAETAVDPFYTGHPVRRVGFGLSFLKQNAELCFGKFELLSAPGVGTRVFASFDLRSIDTPPLGDLAGALLILVIDAPLVRWLFKFESAGERIIDLDLTAMAAGWGGQEALRMPAAALSFKSVIENKIAALRRARALGLDICEYARFYSADLPKGCG